MAVGGAERPWLRAGAAKADITDTTAVPVPVLVDVTAERAVEGSELCAEIEAPLWAKALVLGDVRSGARVALVTLDVVAIGEIGCADRHRRRHRCRRRRRHHRRCRGASAHRRRAVAALACALIARRVAPEH